MSLHAITDADRTLAASVARARNVRPASVIGGRRFPVTVGGNIVGEVGRVETVPGGDPWAAFDMVGNDLGKRYPRRMDAVSHLGRTDDAVKAYRHAALTGTFGTAERARVQAEMDAEIAAFNARQDADRADGSCPLPGGICDPDIDHDHDPLSPELAAALGEPVFEDDTCPHGDPGCDAPNDGEWHCHDACGTPRARKDPERDEVTTPADEASPLPESMVGRKSRVMELFASQDERDAERFRELREQVLTDHGRLPRPTFGGFEAFSERYLSFADVKAVAAGPAPRLVPRLVRDLVEGDRFTLDGTTWHVCAVNLSWGGSIAVYVDGRRDDGAPTVRIDAAETAPVIVEVRGRSAGVEG